MPNLKFQVLTTYNKIKILATFKGCNKGEKKTAPVGISSTFRRFKDWQRYRSEKGTTGQLFTFLLKVVLLVYFFIIGKIGQPSSCLIYFGSLFSYSSLLRRNQYPAKLSLSSFFPICCFFSKQIFDL